MARSVYPYELSDPDMSWLVNNFRENNPNYIAVESTCLPIVLIRVSESVVSDEFADLVAQAEAQNEKFPASKPSLNSEK